MSLGPVGQELESRLRGGLNPTSLEIVDQSAAHAGHSGARPEGETHFAVRIASASFDGLSRVDRQRLVFEHVGDLMERRIHALSIKAETV